MKGAKFLNGTKSILLLNESVRLNLEEDGVKNVIWLVRLEIDSLDEERRNNLMVDLKKAWC